MAITASKKAAVFGILLVVIIQVCHAQICKVPLGDLMECRPSVTPPRPRPPSSKCCKAIAGADQQCLCSHKNSKVLPSFGVDPKLALQLPSKCKIPHPLHC